MAIQLGAVAIGVSIAGLLSLLAPPMWDGVLFIGLFWLANAAVKLLQPSNTVLNDASWIGLLTTGAVAIPGAYLITNTQVLGGWAIVVVFALFLIYGVGSFIGWGGRRDR